MKTRLSTFAVILAFGGIRLFADCAMRCPRVGIGTAALQVESADDANTVNLTENTNATGLSAASVIQAKADTAITSLLAHGSGRTTVRFVQTNGGFSEVHNAAGNGLIVGTLGNTLLIRHQLQRQNDDRRHRHLHRTGELHDHWRAERRSRRSHRFEAGALYTALEDREADRYYRGSAKTINGQIVLELPGSFSHLTEKERMTVLLGHIELTSLAHERDLRAQSDSSSRSPAADPRLEFDYLVQGVRKGRLGCEGEPTGMLPVVNH